MDKVICIELRVDNSRHAYYNRPGDWRPRFIIWPEYGGMYKNELVKQRGRSLDKDTSEAFAYIIAETFKEMCAKNQLDKCVFRRIDPAHMSLAARLKHALTPSPTWWVEDSVGPCRLTPHYMLDREKRAQEEVVYLLGPKAANELILPPLLQSPVLDRTNLLPQGSAIVAPGSGESVVEICLASQPDMKLERSLFTSLENAALRYKHRLERVQRHFCPWWATSNRLLSAASSDEAF